ncbi:digestive cysteine proteinase 2 [Cimex lectularius]|uniref:Uncharacterized protein n=1 Tax=Cimex lectularius TaxID=79782 RepID=A0A8I6RJR1_CIMLE|nr:digestive cysteine proteinase 2 [Cimex lectularius]
MVRTLLITLCAVVGVFGGCHHRNGPPTWSKSYTVRGYLSIPYAELKEDFLAWFDASSGSSRVDYYGGMVKTYQLSNKGSFGSMLKIAPVTTETQLNVPTCLQVNGTKDEKVKPQDMLPDLTNFQCSGTEVVNGVECEKWTLKEQVGEKMNMYTMWLRWKKSPKSPKLARAVPVQYEMKGYNTLLGSHYDHYYLQYDMFSFDVPSLDVFKINDNMTCTHFPGPGIKHLATFNPMKEFIHNEDRHIDHAWTNFKDSMMKTYDNDTEHDRRKIVFKHNFRFINTVNRANRGYQLAINHLADKTDDEIQALRGKLRSTNPVHNGGQKFPYSKEEIKHILKDAPDNFDWRLYGAVTPVKDQSVCGSCWSFGTTGTIEGAYFLKTGHLVRLSQQALIDCSWGFGNNGCDGGEDFRSYQWMMKHGGLPLESDYGNYLGQDGNCHVDKTPLTAKITGFVNVKNNDEDALKVALFKHGPISVAIDAAHKTFSFYSNGVYYEPECKNTPEGLDHSVLAVGYGTLNGKKYWLVKNSWSNLWGNDGYVLMSTKDNNCGVMTTPTYVTM